MNNADNVVELRDPDLEDLRRAKTFLVSPSLTGRLGELIGGPIERGLRLLPRNWNDKVSHATETALFRALEFSVSTMGGGETGRSRNWPSVREAYDNLNV